MKKLYLIILYLTFCSLPELQAQSDLLLSNSGMNAAVFNPAAIVDNGMINGALLMRKQWVGFPDAPEMQHLQLGTFFDTYPMGLQLNITNQTAGQEITRLASLDYAYKLRLSENANLQMGLGAGLYQRLMRYSNLIFEDGSEPLARGDQQHFRPDFAFGFEFYYKDLTIGLAANHITTPTKKATIFNIPIHNHLYIHYLIHLATEADLLAGISYHQQGTVQQLQLDVQLYVTDRFQAGLAFRQDDAFILKAGMDISENFGFVYSYDMGMGTFSNYNTGTHEFVLLFRINKRSQAFYSPRFFEH